jgi:hypothetical protein
MPLKYSRGGEGAPVAGAPTVSNIQMLMQTDLVSR